jgi:transposase
MVVLCARRGGVEVELVQGYYICARCGGYMVTLLLTASGGRQMLHIEPLVCPHCATREERRETAKIIARYCCSY